MTAQTYTHKAEFFFAILDSIDQEVAVIKKDGTIVFANDAWVRFGRANGMEKSDWLRANYLTVCAAAQKDGDAESQEIFKGIMSVVQGTSPSFGHEYPCHSPTENRWFMMTVMGLTGYENQLFVITHSNITLRKLAEIKLESLAQQDPLTGLANRRHFHSYMDLEWNRCRRDQTPISLIMFDIDHFKSINDTYGHTTGDVCLTTVANVIGTFARRPYDLAVRWGGEEFILALAGTTHPTALQIADQIRVTIEQLDCSDYGHCTVSAGVASAIPVAGDYSGLIQQVDEALYSAKETGRNKVVSFEELHH